MTPDGVRGGMALRADEASPAETPVKGTETECVDTLVNDDFCAPLEFESDDDDELNNVDDEIEIEVAVDSGCVANVVGPKDVPRSVTLQKTDKMRNFVAANGDRMKNQGKVNVDLVQESGNVINSSFQVTDVTRPLHATSVICDENKEILYTKGEATVVPEGALSRFLGQVRHIATYRRNGGLYTAKMKIRAPKPRTRRPVDRSSPAKSTFGRPGVKR